MDVLQITGTPQRKHVETDEHAVQGAQDWSELMDNLAQLDVPEVEAIVVSTEADEADAIEWVSDEGAVAGQEVAFAEVVAQTHTVSIQEHATTSTWDAPEKEGFVEETDVRALVQSDGFAKQPVGAGETVVGETRPSEAVFLGDLASKNSHSQQSLGPVDRLATEVSGIAGQAMARENPEHTGREKSLPSGVLPIAQQAMEAGRVGDIATALATPVKPKEIMEFNALQSESVRVEPQNVQFEDAPRSVASTLVEGQKSKSPDIRSALFGEGALITPLVDSSKTMVLDPAIRPLDSGLPTSVSQVQANTLTLPVQNMPVASRDQPVLMQISQAIETAEKGTIELRLDPAELGKVRITMAARDGIMVATIVAERAETLDLLRRNSDSLDMTFNEQGFGETVLDFQQFDQGDDTDEQSFASGATDLSDAHPTGLILQQTSDGLDIRL